MHEIHFADPRKIVIAMVGLPARGKSYIAKKIVRFVNWLGYPAGVFNIGNYRRDFMKKRGIPLNSDYFDVHNQHNRVQREEIASLAMRDLAKFLNEKDGAVAILDGTNTSKARRQKFKKFLQDNMKVKYYMFMVESVCDDPNIIEQNVKKVKIHNPDFEGMAPQEASKEFFRRIQHYVDAYQPLDNSEGIDYMKTINIGQDFYIHKVRGYLQEKIVTFVMNLTISQERIIYLIRHGESQFNVEKRVGGDADLTQRGRRFAESLNPFFKSEIKEGTEVSILTSTLKRTIQTASFINIPGVTPISLKVLDEINAGVCETLTYQQIEKKYPQAHQGRLKDKLMFRYPSGQSYLDLISRLQPIIHWIERQTHPIIVVAHQAVLRCIYAYFFKSEGQQIPHIPINLHNIVKLEPQTYFFNETNFEIDLTTNQVINKTERKAKKSAEHTNERSPERQRGIRKIQSEFQSIRRH